MPENTVLPPRNPGVRAWDELSDDEKRLFCRQMEVFAAYLTHTDDQIGRLLALPGAVRPHGRHPDRPALRQRRQRRGRVQRPRLGDELLQHVPRDGGGHAHEDRRVGRPLHPPPLRHGVGGGRQHPQPLVQADGARGRHPRPPDHPLAGAYRGRGRRPSPVPPRGGHHPHHPGDPGTLDAGGGARLAADAPGGQEPGLQPHRRRMPPPPRRSSTSRCWGTAPSGRTAGSW